LKGRLARIYSNERLTAILQDFIVLLFVAATGWLIGQTISRKRRSDIKTL